MKHVYENINFVNYRYVPYPGGGEKWGGNGVGDDLYSFGFDGANLWTGKLPLNSSKTVSKKTALF